MVEGQHITCDLLNLAFIKIMQRLIIKKRNCVKVMKFNGFICTKNPSRKIGRTISHSAHLITLKIFTKEFTQSINTFQVEIKEGERVRDKIERLK